MNDFDKSFGCLLTEAAEDVQSNGSKVIKLQTGWRDQVHLAVKSIQSDSPLHKTSDHRFHDAHD